MGHLVFYPGVLSIPDVTLQNNFMCKKCWGEKIKESSLKIFLAEKKHNF
jgi:hypothetical protein